MSDIFSLILFQTFLGLNVFLLVASAEASCTMCFINLLIFIIHLALSNCLNVVSHMIVFHVDIQSKVLMCNKGYKLFNAHNTE
jgi:hypothetical protein